MYKTVMKWGTPTYDNDCLIKVEQSQGQLGLFRVTYGFHVKDKLRYNDAAKELGICILHALACEGKLRYEE